jgi:hypothetical protein
MLCFHSFCVTRFCQCLEFGCLAAWYDVRASVHSVFMRVFVLRCSMFVKLREANGQGREWSGHTTIHDCYYLALGSNMKLALPCFDKLRVSVSACSY